MTYTTRIDNTPPTVTAGSIDSCYQTLAAAETAAIAATTATDNCPGVVTKTASTVGDCSATITVTGTDTCGNAASVTYTTRIDNTPPTVTAGSIDSCYQTLAAAETAALAATTATDNCPGTVTKTASTVGDCSATITVTGTDTCGNASSVTYTTRIDNTPPIVTAGSIDSCYQTLAAAEAAAIAATTATDNCPGTVTKTASTVGDCSATITVTGTDTCGNAASVTYTTRIDNTPPTVTAGSIGSCYQTLAAAEAAAIAATTATDNCPGVVTKTASTVGDCSATITVTGTDTCGNAASVTYTTRIDNSPPTVTASSIADCYPTQLAAEAAAIAATTAIDNCGGLVTKTAVTVGTCTATITLTATDSCGNSASANYCTRIDNTPPTITSCPANISVPGNILGSCSANVNPGSAVATDNCTGVVGIVGVRSDANALNAPYPPGTTTITWIATDGCGNASACTQTVTVTNPAPVVSISSPPSGALYPVGTAVSFAGTFTDNPGGTHTALWTFDALTKTGTVNELTGAVTASYIFTSPGVYAVTLTVSDGCGGSATATTVGGLTAMVVIYDPNAGFVTGGGWINSLAGSYPENPLLTGRANFGFVSKYKNGQSIPTGETEFQFQVANFNFHSTVYEWLVVSSFKAQYRGSGTINGGGNYGFLLTVTDGQVNGGGGVDKFRIKIWDKNNGNGVVYDNRMGVSEDIDAADPQAIAGGNIVIHK